MIAELSNSQGSHQWSLHGRRYRGRRIARFNDSLCSASQKCTCSARSRPVRSAMKNQQMKAPTSATGQVIQNLTRLPT